MILDNYTMVEYLENIKNGDAWLSDQELWQAVWDVAEAYKVFGVKIILPYHMRVRRAEKMTSERSRRRRRSGMWNYDEPAPGIWDCLGMFLLS